MKSKPPGSRTLKTILKSNFVGLKKLDFVSLIFQLEVKIK